MVYGAKQLADSFRTVRKNTLQIAEDIPDDKYSFRATADVMTVAEELAHLASFTRWPQAVHGPDRKAQFVFGDLKQHMDRTSEFQATLKTKAQIVAALRDEGERYAAFLESLGDGVLSEIVTFPPEAQSPPKSRLEMLLGVKEHEMHHRAKLMLVQRLIGMVPHLTARRQQFQAHAAAAAAAGQRA